MISMTTENLMFVNIVTEMTPSILKMICVASKNDLGNASSVLPISFESRFIIRPDGFVSKKRIFVEINPRNMASCSFCDAEAQKLKNANDLVNAITNNDAIIPM